MLLPSAINKIIVRHFQIAGTPYLLRLMSLTKESLSTTLLLETTDRGSCLIDKPDGKNDKEERQSAAKPLNSL